MLIENKKKLGINEYSKEIQEVSIRKHFHKEKPMTETLARTDFLYCDPPEVILQSKLICNHHRYREE